jgi:5-methylcytosine-specific restriction protein A
VKKTQGHGNPDWTLDETILALDLHLKHKNIFLSRHHIETIELSQLLKNLPIHPIEKRKDSFRNPDSVSLKILNLKSVYTQTGLTNASRMDRHVVEQYKDRPSELAKVAQRIRESLTQFEEAQAVEQEIQDEDTFPEGKLLTYLHRRRERSPALRHKKIASLLKHGPLTCAACGCHSKFKDPAAERAMFECHHLVPLSEAGEQRTTLRDLALLCASCHRAIHALMVAHQTWLSVEDLKHHLAP